MSKNNNKPTINSSQPENLREILSQKHYQALKESAIDDDVITERGYRTVNDKSLLKELGFPPSQQIVPCMVIPVHLTNGESGPSVLRPDNPRSHNDKIIKYEYPAKQGMTIDCPPRCQKSLDDSTIPLYITEGQKKADSLASQGLCAVALHGVWNFSKKGTKKLLSDFDLIELDHRTTYIVFDSDIVTKASVKQAMVNLGRLLKNNGALVKIVFLPSNETDSKVGVDDFFYNGGTVDQVKANAVDFSTVDEKPAVEYEIVDQLPVEMDRPIKIIDGNGYCVVNVPVRPKNRDKGNSTSSGDGEIQIHQLVVCEDGTAYGTGGEKGLGELPFRVRKFINILPRHQWSPLGVKRFLKGELPDPVIVFTKLKAIFNQFIDFENSLFDQETMCEFCACYLLSTWFIDGLSIVGYLWITGESGSGKSTLMQLFAEMGYLGIFITPSSTFPSIRDLADYGAVLGIDDAECITKPNPNQQDKQNLYLAGNRKDAMVLVKENQPDGKWTTRFVNAFCPKIFTAINMPDSVLSSRCIVIPLVKSIFQEKANAVVTDYEIWPYDKFELNDDLYAITVKNISKIALLNRKVGEESRLMGRALQPFRGLLAVSYWLEEIGVNGIKDRMKRFLEEYQTKKIDFEVDDRLALIVRSIFVVVANATNATLASQATKNMTSRVITVEAICEMAVKIANSEYMEVNTLNLSPSRVGRTLSAIGLKSIPRVSGKGSRTWRITNVDIIRLSKSYNLELPIEISNLTNESEDFSQESNGIDGTSGFTGIHEEKCYMCGNTNFVERPEKFGGGYYCATCHPNTIHESEQGEAHGVQ